MHVFLYTSSPDILYISYLQLGVESELNIKTLVLYSCTYIWKWMLGPVKEGRKYTPNLWKKNVKNDVQSY